MKAVGVVVEYNPFHNGHLYHLNYVKEKYSDHVVIAIMSGNFTQRGEISILSKWDKAEIALFYGVDIVLDLPFVLANESADFFALNSLKILNHFNVSTIVFGGETVDIESYYKFADIQLNSAEYNECVKQFLKEGINYPTACSKALNEVAGSEVNLPNDILGLAYTKAIISNGMNISLDVIQRTNSYHSLEIEEISSATSVRNAVVSNKDFEISVPDLTFDKLKNSHTYFSNDILKYLKYKIISASSEELAQIHLVEEGLENRLKSVILEYDDYNELVKAIATKRYTYSRVSRMLYNILINYSKQERLDVTNLEYYRVLGFSSRGQEYLKYLNANEIDYDISIKNIDNKISEVEYRASMIITLINNEYIENDKIKIRT